MQTGIIGLPQVGKTTLFRILTKAHVEGKAGASATHVGVAKVPEPRLVELAKLYNPKKITYATVNYVDLGGMQKERMRDALAQLREVDVIAHVIRVFDDPSVPHSEGSIDPLRDATNLDLELMLSDHDQIARRLERVDKDLKKKRDPILEIEKGALEKCQAHVEAEKALRELELTLEERKSIGGFLFLSARPGLYVLNLGGDEADKLDTAVERHKLSSLQGRPNAAGGGGCGRLGGGRSERGGEGIYRAGRGCDSFSAQRMKSVVSDQFSVVSFRKREEKKITQRRGGRGDFAEKKRQRRGGISL